MQRFLLPFRERKQKKVLSPTALLVLMIVTLLMILISRTYLNILLCYIFGALLFLIFGASLRRSLSLTFAAFIIIFFLGLPSLFLKGEQLLYDNGIITIYKVGVENASRIWLRGLFSVSIVTLYSTTVTLQEFIYSLRDLFVPNAMIVIIIFILRYTPFFYEQAEQIHIAQQLRGSKKASRLRKFSAAGALVGGTLIRSMIYGEDIYNAMILRGMKDLKFIKHGLVKFSDGPLMFIITGIFSLLAGGIINAP